MYSITLATLAVHGVDMNVAAELYMNVMYIGMVEKCMMLDVCDLL